MIASLSSFTLATHCPPAMMSGQLILRCAQDVRNWGLSMIVQCKAAKGNRMLLNNVVHAHFALQGASSVGDALMTVSMRRRFVLTCFVWAAWSSWSSANRYNRKKNVLSKSILFFIETQGISTMPCSGIGRFDWLSIWLGGKWSQLYQQKTNLAQVQYWKSTKMVENKEERNKVEHRKIKNWKREVGFFQLDVVGLERGCSCTAACESTYNMLHCKTLWLILEIKFRCCYMYVLLDLFWSLGICNCNESYHW